MAVYGLGPGSPAALEGVVPYYFGHAVIEFLSKDGELLE